MRALTFDELSLVSGGEGDCGAGGDCGGGGSDGGGGGDSSSACVVGDGVITCGDSISADGFAQVTITGSGFGQGLTAAQAGQFGAMIGGATGLAAFVPGVLPATMTLGEAIAVGTVMFGLLGVAAVVITAALINFYGIPVPPESTGP
mgnify:FL=1